MGESQSRPRTSTGRLPPFAEPQTTWPQRSLPAAPTAAPSIGGPSASSCLRCSPQQTPTTSSLTASPTHPKRTSPSLSQSPLPHRTFCTASSTQTPPPAWAPPSATSKTSSSTRSLQTSTGTTCWPKTLPQTLSKTSPLLRTSQTSTPSFSESLSVLTTVSVPLLLLARKPLLALPTSASDHNHKSITRRQKK